jgi:hypothetical protein
VPKILHPSYEVVMRERVLLPRLAAEAGSSKSSKTD